MKFKLLGLAIIAVVALAMTQEERYEVQVRAMYDHTIPDSGRVAAAFWHPEADTFFVVHDCANAKKKESAFFINTYEMPPGNDNSIWRSYRTLGTSFATYLGAQFSRNGARLVVWGIGPEAILTVYDVETWEAVYHTHVDSLNTHAPFIAGAVLSPSGDTLLLPDRDGFAGVNLVTGDRFLIDIKPDTIGYVPFSISYDGRFVNGVGTEDITPEYEVVDNSKWFIHDLVTGKTEYYVSSPTVVGTKAYFPPEPGAYYEVGWEGSVFVMRMRSLPGREVVDFWTLEGIPSDIAFSRSGDWMIVGTGNRNVGHVSYVYHRDPYYLAGVVADSINVAVPRQSRPLATASAIFSPDEKWIVGFNARSEPTVFEVKKTLLSVDEGEAESGVLNLKLFPNIIRPGSAVYIGSTSDFKATIQIVDVAGRIIREEQREVRRSGTAILERDVDSLGPGRYFVVVRDDRGKSVNLSLIVQ